METNTVIVRSHRTIGTTCTVHTAWEPARISGTHSTITHIDGVCYGDVASRRIPTDIEDLPGGSPERIRRAQEFMAHSKAEAIAHIVASGVDVEADNARISGGRVEVWV